MQAFRHLLARRHLALLICAAALLLKLVVPAGFMVGGDHGRITVMLCSGSGPATMTMAVPGLHDDMRDHGRSKDHGRTTMPCAFAGLSAAALGAIDPVQLVALIAFVLALGLVAAILPAPSRPAHLRPPLRGPPIHR